jgi:DNA-binding IclR family transcriptional regulator
VAATGESAALWGLDESWRATRCLGCAPSGEPLQVAFAVGAMLPLHAGAAQMALFGELDEFDREVVLAGPLARVTGHTIVDRERVRAELQRLKRRRWAMSVHQEAVGVWSLALMTTEPGATTPMALAVHGPAVRLRREGNQNRLVALTRAVDELTQRLSGLVAGWL